jgi:FkbM family methyltransferase
LLKPNVKKVENYGIEYLIKQARNYKDEPVVVFDIGANCGQFSLLCMSEVKRKFPHTKISIHAFEPNPYVFERLNQNLELNKKLADNIKHFQKGIGEKKATLEIQMPLRNSGAGSLLRNYEHEPNEIHLVDIVSLDEHISKELITEKVAFLKIDVEGFEPKVLMGANKTISNNLPDIYIEMGQSEPIQKFIFNYLRERNYKIFAEIGTSLTPVTEANETYFINEISLYNVFATCSETFHNKIQSLT